MHSFHSWWVQLQSWTLFGLLPNISPSPPPTKQWLTTQYRQKKKKINFCSEPFYLILRLAEFSHFASWCWTQGRWLYSLLACLEKPLLPEAHSSIRQLARRCAQLRSTLASRSAPCLQPSVIRILSMPAYVSYFWCWTCSGCRIFFYKTIAFKRF